jgi:hypothetical protein
VSLALRDILGCLKMLHVVPTSNKTLTVDFPASETVNKPLFFIN